MSGHKAMGGHHSAAAGTTTWLTPPHIFDALGPFDLDPCAAPDMPWRTAARMIALPEDGLSIQWEGRAWVNPPYSTGEVDAWLARLALHGRGTALIFARTETECFVREVFGKASGLLFLAGRLHFHHPDGTRAKANAGAPSVLCAYGQDDLDRLAASPLPGTLAPLRFARGVMVAALDVTWGAAVLAYVRRQGGKVSVSDLYRHFARHPKARGRGNWRAKVRQTVQRLGLENVGPGLWAEGVAA